MKPVPTNMPTILEEKNSNNKTHHCNAYHTAYRYVKNSLKFRALKFQVCDVNRSDKCSVKTSIVTSGAFFILYCNMCGLEPLEKCYSVTVTTKLVFVQVQSHWPNYFCNLNRFYETFIYS